MTERTKIVREILARAKVMGKAVYGYCSGSADCQWAIKDVPWEWDRIAVEGDRYWTCLPQIEPCKEKAK